MFWALRGSSLAGLCPVDESAQITLFPPSLEKLRVIPISSALCSPYLPPAATLGTLDFSLLYDQENNALHCTINKAKVSRRRADANDDVSARPRMLPLMFLSHVDSQEIFQSNFTIVCQQLQLLRPFCYANCETNTSNQNAHIHAHLGAASFVFADPQEGRNRFGFVQSLKQPHHPCNALAKRQIDSIQSTMAYFIFFLFF